MILSKQTNKSFNLSNKTDELNEIKNLFPQNQINDLILNRLKEFKQLQNNIELNELKFTIKREKHYDFSEISFFKRYTQKYLEDADKE